MANELAGFKKVREDKNVAELKHPSGHIVKIAKNALSRPMRQKIESLPLNQAEGSDEPVQDPTADISSNQDWHAPMAAPLPEEITGADNSTPAPAPEGKELTPAQKAYNQQISATTNDPNAMFGPGGEPPKNLDQTAMRIVIGSQNSEKSRQNQNLRSQAQNVSEINSLKSGLGLPPDENPAMTAIQGKDLNGNPVSNVGFDVSSQQAPQQNAAPGSVNGQSLYEQYNAATDAEKQAMLNKGAAEAEGARLQSDVLNGVPGGAPGAISQQEALVNQLKSSSQAIEDDSQKVIDDFRDGHFTTADAFNYNRDNSGKSFLSKLSTGIGIILGGVGQGILGGDNPALKMLQEEGAARMAQNKGLLAAYEQKFHNNLAAKQAIALDTNNLVKMQLLAAAAKTNAPIAKYNAQIAANQLDRDSIQIKSSLAQTDAYYKMSANGQTVDPARRIQMSPFSQQEKTKAFEELKSLEEKKSTGDDWMSAMQQIQQMQFRGLADPRRVNALINPILEKITHTYAGRVTKESLAQLKAMAIGFLDMDPQTQKVKLAQAANFFNAEMHSPLLRSMGVQEPKVAYSPPANASPQFKQLGQKPGMMPVRFNQ